MYKVLGGVLVNTEKIAFCETAQLTKTVIAFENGSTKIVDMPLEAVIAELTKET